MSPFRWQDIDHRLVVLKLVNLGEEMRSRLREDESRIRLENRLNMNSSTVPHLILKMKVERADEWARIEYETYCEVWQTQGYVKSAAFVRAVGAHIISMLEVRARSIANEFSRFGRGTGFPDSLRTSYLKSLDLRMRQLQGRWHRRFQIDAKECEHSERLKNLNALTSSPENRTRANVAPQPRPQDTFVSGAPPQTRFQPIRSSVPLSEFEATVGKLMVQARSGCPAKYLSHTEILRIAVLLDEKQIAVRSNLERKAAQTMAEYNKQHPKGAIKTWKDALKFHQFRRAVRKRFSRAEAKYKEATSSNAEPSGGTPRTTI